MTKKNETSGETLNADTITVADNDALELDTDFNYAEIDFGKLNEDEKAKTFDKLKNQNLMLLNILKDFGEKVKDLEERSVSRVSEENYKRLLADFENYKKRNEKLSLDSYARGKVEILTNLIEVVDNIEIALSMNLEENSKKGIELILKKCQEVLTKNGVTEIDALGKEFDPLFHNAVMQGTAQTKEEEDTIMEVFQKGYQMGEKIIRYSQVRVAK